LEQRKSYPPAENIERMVARLQRMHGTPFPTFLRNIAGHPKHWPDELRQIYNQDRSMFGFIKTKLPTLTYDEFEFLKMELNLITEKDVSIEDFIGHVKPMADDPYLVEGLRHLLYKMTPVHGSIRCYAPSEEGHRLIRYQTKSEITNFYHYLFLRFLRLRTPLFAQVVQHPETRNIGRNLRLRTAKQVEAVFDDIIKPHFSGRKETSTESVNIRRWLEYFGLLYEMDEMYHFETKRFKVMLVGAVCHFLNDKFSAAGPVIKWNDIFSDLINVVHLNPDVADLDELIGLILEVNKSIVQWIPSERDDREFRRQKGKQVLEIRGQLITPKTATIEGSDFLQTPRTHETAAYTSLAQTTQREN